MNILEMTRFLCIFAYVFIFSVVSCYTPYQENLTGYILPHDITFEKKDLHNTTLILSGSANENILFHFNFTDTSILNNISSILITAGNTQNITLTLSAKSVGRTVVYADASPANMTNMSEAYVRVSVLHSNSLDFVVDTVGWLYFTAWSISFYPQIYMNFRRKSVIGLNFDFLALNIVGFLYYSVFNIGLYWIPEIENEYFARHRFGVNPVQLNDVIFSIHAFFACIIQVVQCLRYDKGDQKVSSTACSLLALIALSTFAMAMLGVSSVFQWLDFLYFVSYIKLFITLVKYIPQMYYNYRRRSTLGWSIGNVLLDFVGGSLSIVQMFLLAYNYNDWGSIFGDPTKFGLGLSSMLFDIVFIVQHYCLYKPIITSQPILRSPEHSQSESLLVDSSTHSNYGAVSYTS